MDRMEKIMRCYVKDLRDHNKLLKFDQLVTKYNLTNIEYFKYIQITYYIDETFKLNDLNICSATDNILFTAESSSKLTPKNL